MVESVLMALLARTISQDFFRAIAGERTGGLRDQISNCLFTFRGLITSDGPAVKIGDGGDDLFIRNFVLAFSGFQAEQRDQFFFHVFGG
jgi:hypothetical protein